MYVPVGLVIISGLTSAEAGGVGVGNFAIEGVTNEAKMLVSSIGKYDLAHLKEDEPYEVNGQRISTIDVVSLDEQVAKMFGLLWAYDTELWDKIDVATEQLRQRVAAGQQTKAAS